MENLKYEFKLKIGSEERCIKMFLTSEEVTSLDFSSLMQRIVEKAPSLIGKEVAVKYLDIQEDWVDLQIEDIDSFIDMIETARDSTRVNLKVIQLKVNMLSLTPQDGGKNQTGMSQKRPRVSPSPSPSSKSLGSSAHVTKKPRSHSAKKLAFNDSTESLGKTYTSPTEKFFERLSKQKQIAEETVEKKQRELNELLNTCKPRVSTASGTKKPPVCSICHSAGHNKAICNFPPCPSATQCKDIKRHPQEEQTVKKLQSELKSLKSKTKQLKEDIISKKQSYASSLNTFAAKVQSSLINTNPDKYLRKNLTGDFVPNWLIINTDIRKLEKICKGKVPETFQMQGLIAKYDEGFDFLQDTDSKDPSTSVSTSRAHHVNPVVRLWEQKGIKFPGSGVIPNSTVSSKHNFPSTFEEENHLLELAIEESLRSLPEQAPQKAETAVTCTETEGKDPSEPDYGLSLLFTAANLLDD